MTVPPSCDQVEAYRPFVAEGLEDVCDHIDLNGMWLDIDIGQRTGNSNDHLMLDAPSRSSDYARLLPEVR
jgi:hypothetical protein